MSGGDGDSDASVVAYRKGGISTGISTTGDEALASAGDGDGILGNSTSTVETSALGSTVGSSTDETLDSAIASDTNVATAGGVTASGAEDGGTGIASLPEGEATSNLGASRPTTKLPGAKDLILAYSPRARDVPSGSGSSISTLIAFSYSITAAIGSPLCSYTSPSISMNGMHRGPTARYSRRSDS